MGSLSSYRLLGFLLLLAVSAGIAWQVQAWRYGLQLEHQEALHAEILSQQNEAAVRQHKAEQDKRLALEQQLSASDQQHTRELSDAQRDQAHLRDRLANADVRLSVLLDPNDGCPMPATTTPGSVVHAATRARLDPAHAQRIIGITDDGDNALIALRACQAYVRAVAR
ncbi:MULTISPECIES: lysis system i-spanin subunit Rz [unclassified Pseudomonas]|uniref:lysis system i-spanin subunit Rz n=1 Tax=unclassified Pseudomonas TaxID=196821 RepID=UPI0015A0C4D3|nr:MULTISPECIES: lysis system i-spanin subunit Rz [unclassified Pseudomonas]NWC92396.1 lysis protein [Pseudomonas sp. IPO3779]NWD19822.1 lysis protein [Pseudomonas sp. IPO3778]